LGGLIHALFQYSSKKVLAFAPPFSGDVFGSTFCFGMFWIFSFSMPFLQAPDQNERPLEKNCLLDATQRIRH
jgi:hypothetical protein